MYPMSEVPVQQMFAHQLPFYLSSNENAVPEHHNSPSEGSEHYSFGAPAGDAFVSDGSADSGIGSLAANDEPYLPPRSQAAPNGNPSPLDYSVAPDYVSTQSGHSAGSTHHRHYSNGYADHGDGYTSQYSQQTYAPRHEQVYDYWDDQPYIPPGFTPPPPLAVQTQRHFARIQHFQTHAPLPQPLPRPLIAPQIQQDLPPSPSTSSSSDVSAGQGYSPQVLPPLPPSPPSQPHPRPESHVPLGPDPAQVHAPMGTNQQVEFPRPPRPEQPVEETPRSRQWYETDRYLRNQIGIPEGTRVDLWALPDPPPGQKPQQPLPILVKLAIHGSDKGMLTLQEIYQTLEDRFVYFARLKSSAWKNSIRHNLSLNQVFRSCDRPITEPGKGRYWSVDISKGEGYKRERRRKRRNAAPYNGTRDLPGGVGNQQNNNQADSSDGDQEMEDGTAVAASSAATKATKGKKAKGKRGPYTRVTVGQPSVPGSTGITPGAVASASASTSVAASSPVSGTSTPAPMGLMMYPNPAMSQEMSMLSISSSTSPSMAAGTSRTNASLLQNTIPGTSSTPPNSLPHPIAPYYHTAYGFSKAAAPTFGQTSLPAPTSFSSMDRTANQATGGVMLAGANTPYASAGTRMNMGRAISISSGESSSPEMGERMLGGQQRGGDAQTNA